MTDFYTLGIETSCDETSAAVVKNGRIALSNVISSQIAVHKRYGGVVPEIAARKHIEAIGWIVEEALLGAGVDLSALDCVAVTFGPGLVGALLTGLSYAKGLAYAGGKPLVGVHHIEAHICANYISEDTGGEGLSPPFVCLVASGGHTNIVYTPSFGVYTVLGRTRDDAAGEAFDKVGRALGLPYPGGPNVDKLAREGNPQAYTFPRALLDEDSMDFSFSGLKSAVINTLHNARQSGAGVNTADVAASFQQALLDVLIIKTMRACRVTGAVQVALAGGVACNTALRHAMSRECARNGYRLHVPSPVLCTDNAAMVAACGHLHFQSGGSSMLDINAIPNLGL